MFCSAHYTILRDCPQSGARMFGSHVYAAAGRRWHQFAEAQATGNEKTRILRVHNDDNDDDAHTDAVDGACIDVRIIRM